jgi:hypothetical protein
MTWRVWLIDLPAAILDDAWTGLLILDWYATRAWTLFWYTHALVVGSLGLLLIVSTIVLVILSLLGVPGLLGAPEPLPVVPAGPRAAWPMRF